MAAHKFDPSKMDRLLGPNRKDQLDPDQVLGYLRIGGCGYALLDIGCGPGFFALPAARRMGSEGKVIALDTVPQMLKKLEELAAEAGVYNVETVLAEAEDEYPVPSGAADAALMVNLYHEIDPASGVLSEVKRILKQGAELLIVDWSPDGYPAGESVAPEGTERIGPPMEHRVSPQDVTEEVTAAGFILFGTVEVGPYHYGLKFYKPSDDGGNVEFMGWSFNAQGGMGS